MNSDDIGLTPHQRRNQLARQRGFSSYSQQRGHSREVTNRADLDSLPPDAQEMRLRALDAIADARRSGSSLDDAAWRALIDPQAVAFWAPDAVTRSGAGWRVASADRMFRPMFVYSGGRRHLIDVRGSRVASQVGLYHSAVGHYLSTGDSSRLARFGGVRVAGVELETNPEVIDQLARRGVFEFETIYQAVA